MAHGITFPLDGSVRELRDALTGSLLESLEELDVRTARAEAEQLLESVLGKSREQLLFCLNESVNSESYSILADYSARRISGEPLAYILGEKEFFSRSFFVTPSVLIPRPETELLVERALVSLTSRKPERYLVLDIGCGSGAIVVSLVKELQQKLGASFLEQGKFVAVDISTAALAVAETNAKRFEVSEEICFLQSDLLKSVSIHWTEFDFVLCLSNPPYIADGAVLDSGVENFEPKLALRSGADGLDAIRALISQFAEAFKGSHSGSSQEKVESKLILEIGYDQELEVVSLVRASGLGEYSFYKDLQGVSRVVEIKCQKSFA